MLVPLCVMLGLTGWLWVHYVRTPDLIWTAIDVNSQDQQGDANLLQINQRINILIDTGHELYGEKLLQFLRDRNITRLNAVIITHGHRDHYGGLVFLLHNDIHVDTVYFNPPPAELVNYETWGCNTAEIKAIQHECMHRNIPLIAITDRTVWQFDNDISLRVLYVYNGLDTPIGKTDVNDTSAIIMLTHRDIRILLTGDLNRRLGDYVTKRKDIVPLKADILKVPHHGAEGLADNDFFEAVNPEVMVVPATKALWRSGLCKRVRSLAKDCPTYVNGLHGHIVIKSYGDSYSVETQYVEDQQSRIRIHPANDLSVRSRPCRRQASTKLTRLWRGRSHIEDVHNFLLSFIRGPHTVRYYRSPAPKFSDLGAGGILAKLGNSCETE